jgi:hypothetical protein
LQSGNGFFFTSFFYQDPAELVCTEEPSAEGSKADLLCRRLTSVDTLSTIHYKQPGTEEAAAQLCAPGLTVAAQENP